MNENQFDPITGQPLNQNTEPHITQPIPQAEDTVMPPKPDEAVPPMGAPTEEQPTYRYVPTREPEIFGSTAPSVEPMPPYQGDQPQPKAETKKKAKPLTMKRLVPVMALMLVLAIGLGFAGGFLANRFFGAESAEEKGSGTPQNQQKVEEVTNESGSVVIYETALLVDENGNAVEKPLSVEAIAALVENSVVEITTEAIVSGSFMQQYVSEGAGSGVIFTTDGYIVTNNHVIEGATNITVRLKNGDSYEAELVGADAKTDLAVIKIKASGLKPAAFGKSSVLKVGETVVAVGNPLGELGGTVTQGIISALDRQIDIDNTTMSLLQTDTAINPGNSGGGLFNTSGQLIGVVNAKSAGEEIEGLGFAIPIDTAKTVIEDLIDFGYVKGRPNVGIEYLAIQDTMTAMMYNVNELGLYIYSVEKDSDAANAGLQSGDLIITVDGQEVGSAADANAIFDQKKIGDTVEVAVRRNRKDVTVTMTLTEYAPKKEAAKPNL